MLGTCKTVSHGGATMAAALGVARLIILGRLCDGVGVGRFIERGASFESLDGFRLV